MDTLIDWANETYPVTTTGGVGVKDLYKTLFGKKDKPLCKQANIEGCENHVAVTSWRFDLSKELYAPDGTKQRVVCTCKVRILVPEWTNGHKASKKAAAVANKFLSATTTHERGHGVACKSLTQIVGMFVENMPKRVAVALVPGLNHAYNVFVHRFYVAMARRADHKFDDHSGHGGKLEAELGLPEQDDDAGIQSYMNAGQEHPMTLPAATTALVNDDDDGFSLQSEDEFVLGGPAMIL